MTWSLIDLVGHTCFGLVALSFFAKDMLLLRALSIVAGCVGIIYNYFLPVGTLWIPIIWNVLFISINAYRIIGIFLERRDVKFNAEELELFETLFKGFSPMEFMKLMRIAEWKTIQKGFEFSMQGKTLDGLFLLFNGEAVIKKNNEEIGRLKDGAMIGEISFIRGGQASATVSATAACRVIRWSSDDLNKLLMRNPSMDIGMKQVFSVDLTNKLIQSY